MLLLLFTLVVSTYQQKVSDWRMALIIFAIVSVVIVILVIGTAIPYVRPNAYTSDDLENQPKQV